MFERFTEPARKVVVFAQDEARLLKHNFLGSEHLLLGIMREEHGIAARVLASYDVTTEEIRAQVARTVGQGDEEPVGEMPLTPRATLALELSLRHALALGREYVGTEHLLMGLLETGGFVPRVLADLGASPVDVWRSVFRELGRDAPELVAVDGSEEPELFAARFRRSSEPIYLPRWATVYDWWPPMIAGAGIFGAGIIVGWLIWG